MKVLAGKHKVEAGFTLIELLVVVAILGVIAAVAVLAITRFIGSGNVQSANTERHQALTAITACLAEAGVGTLTNYTISAATRWNGTADIIIARDGVGNQYDASNYLENKKFKASYNVTQSGAIVYGYLTNCVSPWSGIYWNSTSNDWEKL